MMQVLSWSLALLAVLYCTGCETDVNDAVLPDYEERLVVTGSISTDGEKSYISCYVRRTLPLGATFDRFTSDVHDAIVTVHTTTAERIQLNSTFSSYYFAHDSGLVGKTVTLTVSWRGKTATATQLIPRFSAIDTMTERQYLPQLGWHRVVGIRALPDIGRVDVWYQRVFLSNEVFFPNAAVGGRYYSTVRLQHEKSDTVNLRVAHASTAYEDFNNAHASQDGSDWIFPSAGKNPRFNVRGDGIGFFYAVTSRDTTVVM